MQASTATNSPHIFASIVKFLESFVQLLSLYKSQHIIVVSLLKLVVEFARMTLNFLSYEQISILINFCTTLFKSFANSELGEVMKKRTNVQLQTEQEKEQYKQLLLLLKILEQLFDHKAIAAVTFAFSDSTSSQHQPQLSANWVLEAAFYGISIILPLITQDTLSFPKFSESYFNMLNSIFRNHVPQLCGIPDNLFTSLVHSLQYGLHHTNSDVVCVCIESIQILVEEHSIALSPTKRHHIPRLLEFFFNFILFEDRFNMDFVLVAANCLFAFIKHQQVYYQQVVEQLITQQKDLQLGVKLKEAFKKLTSDIDLSSETGTEDSFQHNFYTFVVEVRSMLQRR
jgi:hypothetical protein